jgi:hypothetical protein
MVQCTFFDGILHSEDTIEFHTFAPLEARASVWPMAFLSGVYFSTGSHCKLRPNTEGILIGPY